MAIDPEVKKAVIETWLAGDISINATARQHGLGYSTVHRWIDRLLRDQPHVKANRAPHCDGAPATYTGGWILRGGVRHPRVNIRAASTTSTEQHPTQQEASTAA